MLTQDQINQLEPLTLHPKFGNLLKDAIEVWKRDVNPSIGNWGIVAVENIYRLYGPSCCLLGASLVNKVRKGTERETVTKYFDLENDEWISFAIYSGFDQVELQDTIPEKYKDAFMFGRQISIILFGDVRTCSQDNS